MSGSRIPREAVEGPQREIVALLESSADCALRRATQSIREIAAQAIPPGLRDKRVIAGRSGERMMLNVEQERRPSNAGRVVRDLKDLEPAQADAEAQRWLAALLLRGRSTVVTVRDRLTPARSRALLAVNPENRRLSAAVVDRYARDISNGAWSDNGQTIVVAKDGMLNDGQHRCHAVVLSGREITVVFVIGVERETRFTLDQGKTRLAGDYLGMKGHADPIALAAVAGYIWQHEQIGRLSEQVMYRPTKNEILSIVEDRPSVAASLYSVQKKGGKNAGGRSLLAFCKYSFASVSDEVAADAFIAALIVGANLHLGDPILYARNRLTLNVGRLKPNERAELIFRAWNATRRRETPKTLIVSNGALPNLER